MYARLNRIANGLAAFDLGESRRIAVFAENSIETCLANLGGLIASASVVPVNFHLTASEVAYILNDADARVLFAGPETVDRALEAAAMSCGERVIAWRGAESAALDWESWLIDASAEQPSLELPPRPNLLYTSGTTGRPKGTELPPTMFAGGDTLAEHLALLAQNPLAEFGTHMVAGPMYHTGSLSGSRLLAAGIPSVILGRFDAEKTLATIEEYKIATTVMVPTHFVRLLALPKEVRDRYDVSSMRRIAHTGAKCPVDVKRAMIEWMGLVFVDAYGATEVGTTCAITSEEWLEHPGSVGCAVPPFLEDGVSPPSTRDLIDWCRERLSHYKCPRSIDYVDSIGRNTMGKINKLALRAPYWKEQRLAENITRNRRVDIGVNCACSQPI